MMQQISKTEHALQIRDGRMLSYRAVQADIYQAAKRLTAHGRLSEALDEAEEIRVREYGDMIGVSFRVVTTTRTVSVNGPFENAGPLS